MLSESAHLISVTVEDYFQGRALRDVVDQRQWPRFEAHVERNTLAALDLLARNNARATFFVAGWAGGRNPDLVREIARRGHEVASAGMSGRSFRELSPTELATEAARSRDILESAGGVRVRGYRVADHRMGPQDLWALEVLAQQGYAYDSSLHPAGRAFRNQPWRRGIHRQRCGELTIWEAPLSSIHVAGVDIPVAGGNWFRQLPEPFIRRAVRRWNERNSTPFVMYFRVWDLDPDQPLITSAPRFSRVRHYRNQARAAEMLESFLSESRFSSIGEYLGVEPEPMPARAAAAEPELPSASARPPAARLPVSVVIPCYNEEAALPYLANTLRDLERDERHEFRFIFVDDGSRDRTLETLDRLFGSWPECEIVRHTENRGVAAAILTGIRKARTEVVCSMDCDCTYDPHELTRMIPWLRSGVDLVTASPYHPDGRVLRVPRWRLWLSKGASLMYRFVLRQQLHTYTSCFRVYRRSVASRIQIRETGFLGVAEMLGRMDLAGSRIIEYPATLEVRLLGRSKMRVLRTITGHLRLMFRLGLARLFRRHTAASKPAFRPDIIVSKGMDRE